MVVATLKARAGAAFQRMDDAAKIAECRRLAAVEAEKVGGGVSVGGGGGSGCGSSAGGESAEAPVLGHANVHKLVVSNFDDARCSSSPLGNKVPLSTDPLHWHQARLLCFVHGALVELDGSLEDATGSHAC
jgi:hypothetical protein